MHLHYPIASPCLCNQIPRPSRFSAIELHADAITSWWLNLCQNWFRQALGVMAALTQYPSDPGSANFFIHLSASTGFVSVCVSTHSVFLSIRGPAAGFSGRCSRTVCVRIFEATSFADAGESVGERPSDSSCRPKFYYIYARGKDLFKSKCALLICVENVRKETGWGFLAEGSHLNVKILDLSCNKALTVAGFILVSFVLSRKRHIYTQSIGLIYKKMYQIVLMHFTTYFNYFRTVLYFW